MSRRSASAQQQRLQAEQVQYAKQCLFWTRSLDRNDADMAAVLELNRQLTKSRDYIVEFLGESILLDLGQGKLRLCPDGSDVLMQVSGKNSDELVPVDMLSNNHQDVCLDFLLRQKLRRKLISRIIRRLNRIACSMDGDKDINPPPAPRYGDLRLALDEDSIEQHAARYALQQAGADAGVGVQQR